MNKLLLVILIFGGAGLAFYLFGGNAGDLPENMPEDGVNLEEIGEALEETGERTIYGSCNAISRGSNCIDYVGSVWQDNNMAELNCENAGTFSKNTCPYSEFGGCQISGGTIMEIVTWAYREGPGGYTDESVPYAKVVCNENPMGRWILSEDQL